MTTVQMVPIAKIHVLNSRARNKVKFQEIVASISKVGLKKPITVSRRNGDSGEYDLVCGQGRLEAYIAHGQTEVPALVLEVPLSDRYVMSLVENLARRNQSSVEMAQSLQSLKKRGYSVSEIASKVGLSDTYVANLLRLMEHGEERLVDAVERGEIPIAIASEIAASSDEAFQRSLHEAYASGKLRGRALLKVRRLVEVRRARGKALRGGSHGPKTPSAQDLVRTYRREAQRQQLLVKKAHLCERQLRFVASALRDLFRDDNFVSLLRAESLDSLPKYLADSLEKR